MSQPKWQLVANIGDANPFEHGGFFIFKDKTGKYDLEAVSLTVCDYGPNGPDAVIESRLMLDKCYTNAHGRLVDKYGYANVDYPLGDLESIARCNGETVDNLINQLCSDDPIERGHGYLSIFNYYGSQGDNSILTNKEARKKYGPAYRGYLKRMKNS